MQINYFSKGVYAVGDRCFAPHDDERSASKCFLVICSVAASTNLFVFELELRSWTARGQLRFFVPRYGHSPWPSNLPPTPPTTDVYREMGGILQRIATQADGVRCDMAMLECLDVFKRTWEERYREAGGKFAKIVCLL